MNNVDVSEVRTGKKELVKSGRNLNDIITKEELAYNIKILRQRTDLTQQQIADLLHVDRSTYAYYETAKTVSDIFTLIRLSKIFNSSVENFIEREDSFWWGTTISGVMYN